MARWIGGTLVLAVLALASPATAWAGSPTDELRALFAGASRIMDPRAPGGVDERLGAIRGLLREAVDFREAARLSLGPTWSARTPAEREEFVPVFAEFVERALIAGIAGKIRLGEGIKVNYLDEAVDGAVATVRTTIASRSGLDLPLDYRMIQRGGRWAIRDVVIDNVSLASNYRAQLFRVMQSASYPDLLQQMRARVGGFAATSLAAAASPDHVSMDALAPALDGLAAVARDPLGTSGSTADTIEQMEPTHPGGTAAIVAASPESATGAAVSPLSDPADPRLPAHGGDDARTQEPAENRDRAADRVQWLALDLTLLAREAPESPAVPPRTGTPGASPPGPAAKPAEPAKAGDLAKFAELMELVARTKAAEPVGPVRAPKHVPPASSGERTRPVERIASAALSTEVERARPVERTAGAPPMPVDPPRSAASGLLVPPAEGATPGSVGTPKVAAFTMQLPAKAAEPPKLAALTPAPPARPAAPLVTVDPPRLAALVKPTDPPRPVTSVRPARLGPDQPSVSGRRAGDAGTTDARFYWVQVGAFKTSDAAQRLVEELVAQGSMPASSVVVEPASADVPWARVRVGPFPDRWAAASKVREMQALGHSPFVAGPRD